jgi:hypothetical protein
VIYFLATAEHSYTMGLYLAYWAPELRRRIEIVPYESLSTRRVRRVGTYVFADLERLDSDRTAKAANVSAKARRAGCRVLNDPLHTMRRYDLARMLFESGDNDYQVYRLSESRRPARFPVFLRPENEHRVLSRLITSGEELANAAQDAVGEGYAADDLLVVELLDTSDEHGVYRTYSAFLVGSQVIPRNLFAGRWWKLKSPALTGAEWEAEEAAYLRTNPHQDWIRGVFERAGAQYGKIDYGLLDGRPQVWEINTNPMILWPRTEYRPEDVPAQEEFGRRFAEALGDVDIGAPKRALSPRTVLARLRRMKK